MISLFDRALNLDERSIQAQSWLASALVARVLERLSDTAAEDIERAERLIERVLAASPHCTLGHWAKGQVLRAQSRSEEAIPEFETVIASDRNWVLAFAALGWCKFLTGSIEEAIRLQKRAIRLSPRDPYMGGWYARIGIIHLIQSRVEEAINWFERALGANPGHPRPHVLLASAYGLKGNREQAAAELARAHKLRGNNVFNIARIKTTVDLGVPKVRALFETTFFAGLRKAGMPEE
jgi:tetratricopeptide (TPR) repeat protein